MLHKEAKAMLDKEIEKINLAINADFLPEDKLKSPLFSEFLSVAKQPMVFISCLNIDDYRHGACVDWKEVHETDDLALLVFERSRGALEQLIDRAEDLLERLNKSQRTKTEPIPKENTDG